MRTILRSLCLLLAALPCAAAQESREPARRQEPSSGPSWSFADGVLGDLRNRFGFSLGVYEGYTNNIFRTERGNEDVWATTLMGRIGTNAGRRRHRLHVDYGLGYTFYRGHDELDLASHHGNLQYDYQASRKLTLSVSDHLMSGTNDFGMFGGFYYTPFREVMGASNEVLFARQRITWNTLTGSAGLTLSRKSHLTLFAAHNYYKYDLMDVRDNQGIAAGFNFGYQFTPWLSLQSSYYNYLNDVDQRFRDTQIHRLQFGGFNFRLSRHWQASAGGGIEATQYDDRWRYGGSATAGLSRVSERNLFSLHYHRGLIASIGLPGLYQSNIVYVNYGQRFAPWMNFRLTGHYSRNDFYLGSGRYELIMGHGGLEFALLSNLVASVNASYWDQRNLGLRVPIRDFGRWAAYSGLTYIWPGTRR